MLEPNREIWKFYSNFFFLNFKFFKKKLFILIFKFIYYFLKWQPDKNKKKYF
jgi:hypothetical protein